MTGAVTLVLLPGLDGTEIFLQPLLAALPASVRPVVVTYPEAGGHGYPELLALIRGEVAGLEEFYVLGWSFAGPLALMLAEAEPEPLTLPANVIEPPEPFVSTRLAALPARLTFESTVAVLPLVMSRIGLADWLAASVTVWPAPP